MALLMIYHAFFLHETSWKRYPPFTYGDTRQYFLIFLGDKLKIIFYREIYCWLAKCLILLAFCS